MDVLTNFIPSSMPNFECVDQSNKIYQSVIKAGYDYYTQSNCISYHFQYLIPNCTTINLDGYNSSAPKGE